MLRRFGFGRPRISSSLETADQHLTACSVPCTRNPGFDGYLTALPVEIWAEVVGGEMGECSGVVDERLRDVNWRRVKDHLGLGRGVPRRRGDRSMGN